MADAAFGPPTAVAPGGTFVAALIAIQLRNLGALAAAQKAAMEGIGTLARQQQDMLTARLRDVVGAATLVDTDPRAAVAKPIDAVKSAMLDGTASTNVLGELAARSGATVAGILQDRMAAALDELKAALLQAMPPAAKA